MTWQALIAALWELFGPQVLAWLRDLLKRSNLATGEAPADAALAIHDAFANARANLSWLDRLRGRGAVLNRCERVALSRAKYLVGRCSGAVAELKLTGRELDQITGG
jgi:hypothetical protein